MAVMSTPSTYLDLADKATGGGHEINLFWAESQPDRIHLILTDPRLVDAKGEKSGLRLVFSSNLKSADYSPANFNRCARLLRSLGMPAPAEDVEENPRHLRYRQHLIDSVVPGQGADGDAPAAGALQDAEVCAVCHGYVADLAAHMSAAHPG